VYGESLGGAGGLDRIRSLMGVCPQFDVQWGELTGMEHLRIYARIKVPAGCPARASHGCSLYCPASQQHLVPPLSHRFGG
jgi:ABC-type multidrug transport system ATPase subunit